MLDPTHRERLAAALAAVVGLPRAEATLVNPAGTRFCFLGGLALSAARQGAPITLDRDAPTGAVFVVDGVRPDRVAVPDLAAPHHVADVIDDPFPATTATGEWLGVDLLELTVDPARLPEPLRERLDEHLTAASLRTPARFRLLSALGGPAWSLWSLSDLGVPFDVLADAVRVIAGVECEHVEGTLEHALAASAADLAARGIVGVTA